MTWWSCESNSAENVKMGVGSYVVFCGVVAADVFFVWWLQGEQAWG